MADLLDFRLSLMMHIKIKVFMGFLTKYNRMCIIECGKTCVLTLYITVVNSLKILTISFKIEIFAAIN